MRRILITFVLLIVAAVVAAGGGLVGIVFADNRWATDLNRLGRAVKRLDHDIKADSASTRDADYFVQLSDLPLERFDDKSVTYYAGPFASSSVTIQFDGSGVRGVSVP